MTVLMIVCNCVTQQTTEQNRHFPIQTITTAQKLSIAKKQDINGDKPNTNTFETLNLPDRRFSVLTGCRCTTNP